MVPVIAPRGSSFAGAAAYYFHDKRAWTSGRVAWTHTLNLMTDCISKAWQRMAYTAKHQDALKRASGQRATGAKLKKPVFSYSLAWHPEQKPSKQDMLDAAMQTLAALGLSDHQAIVAAHNDEPHPHVHVIVNAVHPLTGLVAKLKHTKRKLSDFARAYERAGGKVYCPQREANHAKRQAGQQSKYVDPVIKDAWQNSTDGRGFADALKAQGYQLAQGRRLVVVDPHGNIINPARALGIKAAELKRRINDLNTTTLPTLEDLTTSSKQTKPEAPKPLPPDVQALQVDITRLKDKLRQGGLLARLFGVSAYRKRRLYQLRQQFKNCIGSSSQNPSTYASYLP